MNSKKPGRNEEDEALIKNLKSIAKSSEGISISRPMHIIKNSRTQLLIFMVVLYFFVNYVDLFKDPNSSLVSNIRMASFLANLVMIYLGVLFLPEPSKKRPFPLFWKVVQSAAFAYAINVLLWLCFSKENLQNVLKVVYDGKLGQPLGEKSYADDCRIITPENPKGYFYNITSSMDMFVAAHFLGWMFKMWIFRNSTMAWFLSIGFEVMEWTMEVWLPNFKECWWDHFLFDMFGCNLIGMLIGSWTMKKFNMRKMNWFMERTEKWDSMNWWQQAKYIFTSREDYIKEDKWHWLSELWTFNAVVWFWVMNLYLDLSYFYNKAMLEIPPPHWLCSVRIWILAFFAILAANDYYDYVVSRKCNSMTLPVFLIHVIMILEGALFLKNIRSDLFETPVHYHIKLFWISFFLVLACAQMWLLYDRAKRDRKYVGFENSKKLK